MSIDFKKKSELQDHQLKQTRMVFEVSITANATPANKSHIVEIPGCTVLRTEGKTAEADAIENLTGQVTAPVDATGIFALLVDEKASKFHKATVTPSVGTITVTKSISTGGRLLLDMDSNQDLSTTSLTLLVELEYKSTNSN